MRDDLHQLPIVEYTCFVCKVGAVRVKGGRAFCDHCGSDYGEMGTCPRCGTKHVLLPFGLCEPCCMKMNQREFAAHLASRKP